MARRQVGLLSVFHARKILLGSALILVGYAAFLHLPQLLRRTSDQLPSVSVALRKFISTVDVVDFTKADNITGFPYPIVPNVVHYIKFRTREIHFHELISMLSVLRNHKPDQIIIHCSECTNGSTLQGKYWDMLQAHRPPVVVSYFKEPTHIYGKPFSSAYHATDVSRILILMKYGGIFLDGDVYVAKSLDRFRHYEMALGWPIGQFLGTQVLVAHKNARFLRLWLYSYHWYNSSLWYYNAGELPTTSILYDQPELVHRVPLLFGVHFLVGELYKRSWPEWKTYYAIHLLIRHRSYLDKTSPIKEFDEENIKTYNYTFGEMARLVLYNTTEFITK